MLKLNFKKLNWGRKARVSLRAVIFPTLFILAILAVFISQSKQVEAQSWFSGAATTGYRATIGVGNVTLWDSSCKQVTNANASLINYFIPTKTSTEWTAFLAAAPIFTITISECGCPAGTLSGYSYAAVNNGSSVGTSKSVANGTCSATVSCSANSPSLSGENASCNAGYFNANGSCADGCESRCGDGVCNNGETTATCGADCGCTPGATRTMYSSGANGCGTYCLSEGQTCQAGTYTYNGSYTSDSCSASTRTGYTTSSVNCSSSCTTQGQTCTSGGWSGTGIGTCSPVTCSGGTPYCVSGSCVQCTAASQCGTNGWEGALSCSGANIVQNYRTYSCNSNTCGSSAPSTLKSTCSGGTPYCSGGSCVACTAASQCGSDGWEGATSCSGNNVYQNYRTYTCSGNTCGSSAPSTLKSTCSGGTPYCVGGSCVACTAASQCGSDGWEGALSCSGSTVMQNYRTYSCNSNTCGSSAPSTAKSSCSGGTPYCVSGSCVQCTAASQCGTTGYEGGTYCASGYVKRDYRTYSCSSYTCGSSLTTNTLETCDVAGTCQSGGGCSNGACVAVSGGVPTCTGGTYLNGCTCSSCPAGSWCGSGSILGACFATYYCPGGDDGNSMLSHQCSGGTYSGAGQSSCTSCPAGSWCCSGSICAACYAGYYCPGGDTATSMLNQPCNSPSFSGEGASHCTTCPGGYTRSGDSCVSSFCCSCYGAPSSCNAQSANSCYWNGSGCYQLGFF